QITLQGNMDPSVLYSSPENIRNEVGRILESFGSGEGHVFNLGHGIALDADPDHAKVFVDAVHELSAKFHA
ncbi:MAG: uroporphyrinogen decarboxylase, partial [Pseudomonadales bacterium]|nr:uroporphyrinogen decarboxylase [Pseudomonadales bacterium]